MTSENLVHCALIAVILFATVRRMGNKESLALWHRIAMWFTTIGCTGSLVLFAYTQKYFWFWGEQLVLIGFAMLTLAGVKRGIEKSRTADACQLVTPPPQPRAGKPLNAPAQPRGKAA